jgi:thioredoxin 1
MATIELTSANFSETVEQSDAILIDFWAEWCGPCKRFGPVFDAASEKHPGITFAKLDTENNQDIAAALEITSIPTLMVVKGGMLLYREAGALNAVQLEGLISEVEKVDIEALKAEAAQPGAAGS